MFDCVTQKKRKKKHPILCLQAFSLGAKFGLLRFRNSLVDNRYQVGYSTHQKYFGRL